MGASAAPIIISLLAAGTSEANNRRTARQRDRDIAAGITKTSAAQREGTQKINENLNQLEKSRPEPFKETLQGQFLDRIRKQKGNALAGFDTAGGTSTAFKDSVSNAKTGAIDYGSVISDLLSGIDAAGLQRQSEGFKANDLGMELSKLNRGADQDAFLARLRAGRRRPNFGLSLLSAGLSGAAGAAAGGGSSRSVDNGDFLRQAGFGG